MSQNTKLYRKESATLTIHPWVEREVKHLEVVEAEAEREEEEKQPTLHSLSMAVLLLGGTPSSYIITTWPPVTT